MESSSTLTGEEVIEVILQALAILAHIYVSWLLSSSYLFSIDLKTLVIIEAILSFANVGVASFVVNLLLIPMGFTIIWKLALELYVSGYRNANNDSQLSLGRRRYTGPNGKELFWSAFWIVAYGYQLLDVFGETAHKIIKA